MTRPVDDSGCLGCCRHELVAVDGCFGTCGPRTRTYQHLSLRMLRISHDDSLNTVPTVLALTNDITAFVCWSQ